MTAPQPVAAKQEGLLHVPRRETKRRFLTFERV